MSKTPAQQNLADELEGMGWENCGHLLDSIVSELKSHAIAKTAAQRKADERKRKRESGLVLVQEWAYPDRVSQLRKHAAKLRTPRNPHTPKKPN